MAIFPTENAFIPKKRPQVPTDVLYRWICDEAWFKKKIGLKVGGVSDCVVPEFVDSCENDEVGGSEMLEDVCEQL